MTQLAHFDAPPTDHHLAEFNWGILRYDWGDPRIAEFETNLDRVNAVAARTDGFIWQMPSEQMESAQLDPAGPFGGNPRLASTLSVWRDPESLKHFVWNTLHQKFLRRGPEWFADQPLRLVMWWVPIGERPTIEDAVRRLEILKEQGDGPTAFGWSYLKSQHRASDA